MKKISALYVLLTLVPFQTKPISPLGDAFDGFFSESSLAAGAVLLVAGGAAVGIAIYKCLSGRHYCSGCSQIIKKDDTCLLVASCGHRFHLDCYYKQLNCDTCKEAIIGVMEYKRVMCSVIKN